MDLPDVDSSRNKLQSEGDSISDPQHFAVMTLYKVYSRSMYQSSRFLRSCRTLDLFK